jgi:mannosyltransferase OCH1-like enzyme
MARRRTLWISITLLGLVLLGTVIVLSTFSYYLAINDPAYLSELELEHSATYGDWVHKLQSENDSPAHHSPDASHHKSDATAERIPRILHQTWKSETLPDRWKGLAQGCRDMHPD